MLEIWQWPKEKDSHMAGSHLEFRNSIHLGCSEVSNAAGFLFVLFSNVVIEKRSSLQCILNHCFSADIFYRSLAPIQLQRLANKHTLFFSSAGWERSSDNSRVTCWARPVQHRTWYFCCHTCLWRLLSARYQTLIVIYRSHPWFNHTWFCSTDHRHSL